MRENYQNIIIMIRGRGKKGEVGEEGKVEKRGEEEVREEGEWERNRKWEGSESVGEEVKLWWVEKKT